MKTISLLYFLILFPFTGKAQDSFFIAKKYKNHFEIGLRHIVNPDSKGVSRYLQTDFSYFNIIEPQLFMKYSLSLFENTDPPPFDFTDSNFDDGLVLRRNQEEVEIGVGYQSDAIGRVFYRYGISPAFRHREDAVIHFLTPNRWNDSYIGYKDYFDLGICFWAGVNIITGKHTYAGAYFRKGFYINAPDNIYYGVQIGYGF
jgi:hypothetical protein